MKNGWLYLMFRVGNLRTKSNLIEAHVKTKVIYPKKLSSQKEGLSFEQEELRVSQEFGYLITTFEWLFFLLNRLNDVAIN